MKAIDQITLKNARGEDMRDTAPDVLSKEHLAMVQRKEPLPDDAGNVMTTLYLIQRMLDLSQYENRPKMKKADELYQKLKVTNGKILLEDADYDLLKELRDKFTPYLQNRIYEPFHQAIENAETVEVDAKTPKKK